MSDEWTDRLSAYLDDELGADERAAFERHAVECQECRTTLNQLGSLRTWAEGYEGLPTSEAVWVRVREGIKSRSGGAKVVSIQEARPRWRQLRFAVPLALAATMALGVVGVGSWWLGRVTAPRHEIVVSTLPARLLTTSSQSQALLAAERYGAAIAQLEQALLTNGGQLDTATVRILTRNLAVIDRAIRQAREALATDPGSAYLADHYTNMMQRKLTLLRRAASVGGAAS
jgi:anti-sigma factor RsiW